MIFIPTIFIIGINNLEAFFLSFAGFGIGDVSNLAVGAVMFALPFIAPFMVAIGAMFGMGREIVESEGTSAEGVFTWYKKRFLSLAGGGIVLFLFIIGPLLAVLVLGGSIYGDQFWNIALISVGSANTANPIIIGLLFIWFAISTGLLSMLFPSIIDGYSVFESIKRSLRLSFEYFDRVFGVWLAFLLVLGVLAGPLFLIPMILGFSGPLMVIASAILIIYAIPAAIILVFFYLPAMTIGLTRVYMILTADDDDYETHLEDTSGPSFIGGV